MEVKKMSGLLIGLLGCVLVTNAQNEDLDCKANYKNALYYLQGTDSIQKDSLKAVSLIQACLERGDSDAQLLQGQLYLGSHREHLYKTGFSLVYKAASRGNVAAAFELGVLYKYGKGCRLNFDKALEWFQKAAEGGSEKAAYSIGYLHYKGLGTVPQDYAMAVTWFQRSNHPRAKHWLAICYYYGYGVPQDRELALEMLQNNGSESSYRVYEQLRLSFEASTSIDTVKTEVDYEQSGVTTTTNTTTSTALNAVPFLAPKLSGAWQGNLVQYDWSGTRIEQVFPISLQMDYDAILQEVTCRWAGAENSYIAILEGSTLYFEELFLYLPRLFFDDVRQKKLRYQILSSNFEFKESSGILYATAILESDISAWREPGAPMRLVLSKDTSQSATLSLEALTALAGQKDNFIKVHPNPFQSQLLITYTLDTPGEVSVQLSSFDGTFTQNLLTASYQQAGEQQAYYDGSGLATGNYVIRVMVHGEVYTKIIIKNKL